MSRRIPASRPPLARVVHYIDPATQPELAYPLSPAELAARQHRQQVAYLRWKARQEAIAARDRKVRRFWLGFGAVIGLAVLAALVTAGWLLWAVTGLGALAVPVLLAALGVAAVGGHKCVTVVQHWH